MLEMFLGVAVTVLLLVATHWAPWPRKLHRVEAYVIGIASMLAGQAIWLGSLNQWDTWFGLVGWAAASGLAVIFAYTVDWLLRLRIAAKMKNDGRD